MTVRAVVLGAGGFLGSHLARRLVALEWDVVGVVRDPDAPHVRTRLGGALGDMRLVVGDATDHDLVRGLVADVDAVFPFAGHSGAARSMAEPFHDLVANAGGQLAVLEAVRVHNPMARIVFPGSRLQYGRARYLPVDELHPQDPTSLYGLHKLVGDQYYRLYHDLYGLRTACLRISNPYGPHQDRPDRAFGVVGTFLSIASANGSIPVYGGGAQTRDYVYVGDVVDVCVLAATHTAAVGRTYNVGGPAPVTVREMAEAVVSTVGAGRVVDAPWPDMEGKVETGDYTGDLRRAATELGWAPTVGLTEGLAATWDALAPTLSSAG